MKRILINDIDLLSEEQEKKLIADLTIKHNLEIKMEWLEPINDKIDRVIKVKTLVDKRGMK